MVWVLLQCPSEILDDLLVLTGGSDSLSRQSPVPEKDRRFLQALGRPPGKPGGSDQSASRQFTQDMPAAKQMREPSGVG